jgi:hypothetical protein
MEITYFINFLHLYILNILGVLSGMRVICRHHLKPWDTCELSFFAPSLFLKIDICCYNDTSDISIKNGREEFDTSHLYLQLPQL